MIPFRTIYKDEIENNSYFAKDENGVWLNEWMAARQTVSDREATFISDLTTAITDADGTSG